MLTPTPALLRTVRTHRRPRRALILALGALLAIGTIASTPATAFADVAEVRTALPSGVELQQPFMKVGSHVVWGSHRSADGGATWTTGPAFVDDYWPFGADGRLVTFHTAGRYYAAVYTVATGTVENSYLLFYPSQINNSWALASTFTGYTAFNYITGESLVPHAPFGAQSTPAPELTPSGGLAWRATQVIADTAGYYIGT